MNDTFGLLQKYTGISKYSQSEVITPQWVVSDMVDLLPQEVFNPDATFFDPAVKSGRFLIEIYNRLMASDLMKQAFPNEQDRHQHIIENQLYGFATSPTAAIVVRKALYDNPLSTGNIRFTSDKLTKELVQGAFNNMKVDVVIGNPPYNKGMDLDFVDMGFELSKQYTVMITPAKWQTAEANQKIASKMTYEKFREQIVPHMNYVCFYPDALDVFGIGIREGITWFLLDKQTHEKCRVVNKCKLQKWFNSEKSRCIANGETLHNIGAEIVSYLGEYKKFRFNTVSGKEKYSVWSMNDITIGGRSGSDYFLLSSTGQSVYVGTSKIIEQGNILSIPNASVLTFESNDIADCQSFISWLNTKFTRFFVAINLSSRSGVMENNYFRFVPAPLSGKFDHIYTDEELYEAFNLPQKYIDVIEAVIKERK